MPSANVLRRFNLKSSRRVGCTSSFSAAICVRSPFA
jgi:hypothetical protein